jgi:hypothetical protein
MISPQPTTHPHDLMKPDLFSEILLAATGFILSFLCYSSSSPPSLGRRHSVSGFRNSLWSGI